MAVIDAHAHVWSQDLARYPFAPLDGLPAPRDVRSIAELAADSAGAPIDGVLLIQPRVYGHDHRYVYAAAQTLPGRARVMPLIDVAGPTPAATLSQHARNPATAGLRVIALGGTNADRLSSAAANRLWEAGEQRGLPVGFLIDPCWLPLVEQVAEFHPGLIVIIDHLARCNSRQQPAWTGRLCAVAERPNVYVKISAIGALSMDPFPHRDMWPLLQSVYTAAGAARLLWGSDWPHTMAFGGYARSREAISQALAPAPPADLDAIFGTTAAHLFGFDMDTTMAGETDGNT
jgi:L-fuconolactonase